MFFVKDPYEFPKSLSDTICKTVFGTENPSNQELKSLESAFIKIWNELAVQRGQVSTESHYSFDTKKAKAYAAYYLTANCLKSYFVFDELKRFGVLEGMNKINVLEFESGPGTAASGLLHFLSESPYELNYVGIDQSKKFTEIASDLIFQLKNQYKCETSKFEFISDQKCSENISKYISEKRPNFIIFMNSIAEIFSELELRKKKFLEWVELLTIAAKKTGEKKIIIFIDPGSKISSRELLALRDSVLTNPEVRILTPCLSNRKCGAYQDIKEWCHEDVECVFPEWHSRLGQMAGLKKESLLFSYLVFQIGGGPTQIEELKNGNRVVSQLIREKGLNKCFICMPDGRKQVRLLSSRTTEENKDFNKVIRGDVLMKLECSEKGDVLRFEKYSK
jgi:hypothetical protein